MDHCNALQTEDVDTVRAKLDEEIALLEVQIARLRRRRNDLASIMRLPSEVLLRIMMEHKGNATTTKRLNLKNWIGITYVCQYWRTLALDFSVFWSTIRYPEMTAFGAVEFIQRSRHCPLDLSISPSLKPHHEIFIQALAGAVHRVETLSCRGVAIVDYGLVTPASSLRALEVNGCSSDSYKQWVPTFQLQRLSLKSSYVHVGLLSPSLTTLQLSGLGLVHIPSGFEFYQVLSRLVNLEDLSLKNTLSVFTPTTNSALRMVSLPCLRTLRLEEYNDEDIQRFMTCVTHSSLRRFSIGTYVSESRPLSSSGPLAGLWSCTRMLNDRDLLGLTIRFNREPFISVSSGNEEILEINWYKGMHAVLVPYINFLETCLPLKELRLLTLQVELPIVGEFLSRALPVLAPLAFTALTINVELMSAIILDSIPFCLCGQQTIHMHPSLDSSPLSNLSLACSSCQNFAQSFFPQLRTIVIEVHRFDIKHNDYCFDRRKILRFCCHRSLCGKPLEQIVFEYKSFGGPGNTPDPEKQALVTRLQETLGDLMSWRDVYI
ncbi:hypothetical protein AX16_004844 [Volvariella volvacea WC 439]|nr:hypothetical protein AX16_004844 [Volvariella volvacea WC 439]